MVDSKSSSTEKDAVKSNVECQAILANTNTIFNALDFNSKQGLLAYACANSVLVADTLVTKKVLFSLGVGSSAERINAVKWLGEDKLVAISNIIVVFQGEGHDGANWKAI